MGKTLGNSIYGLAVIAFLATILWSCKDSAEYKKVDFSELKNFDGENITQAINAFEKSCNKLSNKENSTDCEKNLIKYCKYVEKAPDKQSKTKNIEDFFTPFQVSYPFKNKGLFTAYYEPIINISIQKDNIYRFPIISLSRRDSSLKQLTRAEITTLTEDDIIAANGEVIYWTDDIIQLFFMQIQGSGKAKIISADNSKTEEYTNLAFQAKNDHNYYAIGKYFIEHNIIKKTDISAQAIIDKLNKLVSNNQWQELYKILNLNESYVFFQQSKQGATGGSGTELTAEGSIAIDSTIYPYHLPLWIEAENYHKLLISQDTGSAIRGHIRGDVFMGSGKDAFIKAENFAKYGNMFILVPQPFQPSSCF